MKIDKYNVFSRHKTLIFSILIIVGANIYSKSNGLLLDYFDEEINQIKSYSFGSEGYGTAGDFIISMTTLLSYLLIFISAITKAISMLIKFEPLYKLDDWLFIFISAASLLFLFFVSLETSAYRTIIEDKNVGLIIMTASMLAGSIIIIIEKIMKFKNAV